MPTTYAIPNGRTAMDATLWTGDGSSSRAILNADNGTVGFKPDFVWVKNRNGTYNHYEYDSVRGVGNFLTVNDTVAEGSFGSIGLTAFNTNGFSIGNGGSINQSASTYVGWQWVAGQGVNNTNTSGTITSTVSANTTTGFSIVTYTGTGTTGTVGHGLSTAPSMIVLKVRNQVDNWLVYHSGLPTPATNTIILNTTGAVQTGNLNWNSTNPTSSVFSVYNPGSGGYSNGNGYTYVAYCWATVAGFSQFGSYTGNGSTDGPFVYTGFRPKFILIKRTDSVGDWLAKDTSRNTSNSATATLYPDLNNAETTGSADMDILSNGFKCRSTGSGDLNGSGGTYIYAAFAENPFKYANAR